MDHKKPKDTPKDKLKTRIEHLEFKLRNVEQNIFLLKAANLRKKKHGQG